MNECTAAFVFNPKCRLLRKEGHLNQILTYNILEDHKNFELVLSRTPNIVSD